MSRVAWAKAEKWLNTGKIKLLKIFYSWKYLTGSLFICVVMYDPQVVKVFASLLEEISKQIGGLSSQNTELHVFLRNILKVWIWHIEIEIKMSSFAGQSDFCSCVFFQMMVQTLESLSGFVRHVCSFEESVSFDAIRSLPSCILSVLKDTFQHCKVPHYFLYSALDIFLHHQPLIVSTPL